MFGDGNNIPKSKEQVAKDLRWHGEAVLNLPACLFGKKMEIMK